MDIVMPKLGLTMTEGTLTEWRQAEGDTVKQGEILFEFESEKSVLEFESPADGVLTRIIAAAGETVPCGTPVAVLETAPAKRRVPEHDLPQKTEAEKRGITAQEPSLHPPVSPPLHLFIFATPAAKRRARELGLDLSTVSGRGPDGRIQMVDVEMAARATEPAALRPITPVAKRVAADLEVDLSQISGSGPRGRIIKEDVLQAAHPAPVSAPSPRTETYDVQPLTGVRRVIAQRMSDSSFTAPHVTLFTEADASALVEARTQLNAELAPSLKISYNALLIAIVARVLREQPHLNACLVGDEIRRYHQVNIALAVDTERGLLVPVIRNADQLDLVNIQQTGDALIQRALAGKSLPDDLTGGTFTITNLGVFDIDGFTPIINQPQAAILGVGRIASKPVVVDNEVVVRQMMTLSLSFDHRIVDGGPAARFLQRVKQLIERPFALVIQSQQPLL